MRNENISTPIYVECNKIYRSKVCVQEFWYIVSGLDIQPEQFENDHPTADSCEQKSCFRLRDTTLFHRPSDYHCFGELELGSGPTCPGLAHGHSDCSGSVSWFFPDFSKKQKKRRPSKRHFSGSRPYMAHPLAVWLPSGPCLLQVST